MSVIPERSRRRLVLLLEVLDAWQKPRITSREVGAMLGCKDSLVRHDFSFLDVGRGVSNGYDVRSLKDGVKKVLGLLPGVVDEAVERRVCVVGLGRLGSAFLDDGIFFGRGFKVVAGFDSSVNRLELMRSVFELYPASRIESVVPQHKIEYAILCCSEEESAKMAGRLVNAGIKGIVNFTNSVISVPRTVKVENVSPVMALLNM